MSATAEVPTGNTFDKYGSSNPVVRRLMTGFHSALDELWDRAAPESVLDVGCGEGVLTVDWAQRLGDRRVELELGVEPSHYEPGADATGHPATTGAHAAPHKGRTEEREALKI